MPKLRFRATTNIQPVIATVDETIDDTVTIETTVTTPTTIQLLSVTVPTGPTTNWGNRGAANGWVCANAPFPIGTGTGCYESIGGTYTNTIPGSPSNGITYLLPCIPYNQGGSCFQYKTQATGSPACESFCLQS